MIHSLKGALQEPEITHLSVPLWAKETSCEHNMSSLFELLSWTSKQSY